MALCCGDKADFNVMVGDVEVIKWVKLIRHNPLYELGYSEFKKMSPTANRLNYLKALHCITPPPPNLERYLENVPTAPRLLGAAEQIDKSFEQPIYLQFDEAAAAA